jgi:transposase
MIFEKGVAWLRILPGGKPTMPKKKYIVALTDAEREQLEQLLRSGKHATRKITRARILLKAAAGCRDEEIVEALGVGRVTVERVRQRFVERGLDALNDGPRPGKKPKLDAKGEARLIAEACSKAPEGREHWTLQLLSDRVVALGLTESYTAESVRKVLKKTKSSRG